MSTTRPAPSGHSRASTPIPGSWRVDGDSSHARFVAGTFGGALKVAGVFRSISGSLVGDDQGASGVLEIDPTSVVTRNRLRDRHLRGRDFFGAAKHPHLRYELRSLTRTGADRVRLEGDLLVAGTYTELPLEATLRMRDDDHSVEIACRTTVDRVALGVRGARGMVPRMVDLDVAVVLRPDEH